MILYNISLVYYCFTEHGMQIASYVVCSNYVYTFKFHFLVESRHHVITLTFHCSFSLCACLPLLLSDTQTHTSEGRWEASLFAPPPVSRTCAVSDVKGSIVIKSGPAIFIVLHGSGQSLTIQTTGHSITSLLPLLFFLSLPTSASLSQ